METKLWISRKSLKKKKITYLKTNTLQKKVAELNITDDEIIENALNFIVMENSIKDSDSAFLFDVYRDENNKIKFYWKVRKNEAARQWKIERNLILTSISSPYNTNFIDKNFFEKYKDIASKRILKYAKTFAENLKENKEIPSIFFTSQGTGQISDFMSSFALHSSLYVRTAYININDLNVFYKNSFSSNSQNNYFEVDKLDEVIKELSEVPVLVLNELGISKFTINFLNAVLMKILENRYKNNKTTLVSSYQPIDKLSKKLVNNETDNLFLETCFNKFLFILDNLCTQKEALKWQK